jgi:membrane-associated protease RseP (regulator of RpoE activity)
MIPREVDISRARIGEVIPNSPAAEAGLVSGDVIFAVNGTEVQSTGELGYQIRLNLGHTVDMRIKPAVTTGERDLPDDNGSGFVEVPVYARWSADPYTYDASIAEGDSIGANESTPITLNVSSTEGFATGSILTIDPDTANEEVFEYCVDTPTTLILMDRALADTKASAHSAGAPIEHKVAQGPTGITIGPAYTNRRLLTEEERAKLEDDLPPCIDEVPAYVDAPVSETQHDGPIDGFVSGTKRSWESLVLARNEIISRVRGGVGGSGGFQVTGPVGIAQLTGEVVEEAGWKSLLEFAGLISMNLAILNILPLPMLDGGRIVFVLLEWVRRGKRIAPEREAMVHFVGLVAMLGLALVITYFDILRIFSGENLLK